MKIITIGKTLYSSGLGNWSDSNLPMLVDDSPYHTWLDWNASIRDIYFLYPNGTLFDSYNISMPGYTNEEVITEVLSTINTMLTSLPENSECINTNGDLNCDTSLNILDIAIVADAILNNNCTESIDINDDSSCNLLDLLLLVYWILY